MLRVEWVGILFGLGMASVLPSAATGAEATVPGPRIEPLADLDSLALPTESAAWSPRGSLLSLRRDMSQVWVFDATRPKAPPRLVYDAGQSLLSNGWSPDGTWLLLLIGAANPMQPAQADCRPSGRRPAGYAEHGGRGHRARLLGPGRSHPLPGSGPEWLEQSPPARWKPNGFVARLPLAFLRGPNLSVGLYPARVTYQIQELVCRGPTWRSEGLSGENRRSFRVIDALPDDSRLLVAVAEDTSANGGGGILTDLRRAGIRFEPTSLSGDGRLIVGFSRDGAGGSRLEAADAGGHWSARIAGGEGGEEPRMSREGSFIAFRTARGTRVARLMVGPR